jgi:hypothetical protein
VRRASSFVAAESLEIAKELDSLDGASDLEQILTALLYLIAGYDANARVAIRELAIDPERSPAESYALKSAISFLAGEELPEFDGSSEEEEDGLLHERIEGALMRFIGDRFNGFSRSPCPPKRAWRDCKRYKIEAVFLCKKARCPAPG